MSKDWYPGMLVGITTVFFLWINQYLYLVYPSMIIYVVTIHLIPVSSGSLFCNGSCLVVRLLYRYFYIPLSMYYLIYSWIYEIYLRASRPNLNETLYNFKHFNYTYYLLTDLTNTDNHNNIYIELYEVSFNFYLCELTNCNLLTN
jgi:hypothetical protein